MESKEVNPNTNNGVRSKKAIVKKLLKQEIDANTEDEIMEMLIDKPISVDVDKEDDRTMTTGDRIADKVAEVAGSWPFIIIFGLFLVFWIILNTLLLRDDAIDAYPFILLNLLLSCISALQAPIIMMSQNRQAKKDSLRNQNDYQVDLKSELILEDIHEDIKNILTNQRKIIKLLESDNDKKE